MLPIGHQMGVPCCSIPFWTKIATMHLDIWTQTIECLGLTSCLQYAYKSAQFCLSKTGSVQSAAEPKYSARWIADTSALQVLSILELA